MPILNQSYINPKPKQALNDLSQKPSKIKVWAPTCCKYHGKGEVWNPKCCNVAEMAAFQPKTAANCKENGQSSRSKKNNGQTKFPNHFGPFFMLWSTYSNTPSKNYRKDFMAISVSTMFFSICSRGVALSIRNIHMYVCICIYIYSYILSFGASAETPQALKLLSLRKRRSFDSSGRASIASRDAWDHQVCGVPRRTGHCTGLAQVVGIWGFPNGFLSHGGTPKWMVCKGKSHHGWWLGVPPHGNPHILDRILGYSAKTDRKETSW